MHTRSMSKITFKTKEKMEKKFNTKGIEFVPKNIVSEETKLKLSKLMTEKAERLTRLVSDYKASSLRIQ